MLCLFLSAVQSCREHPSTYRKGAALPCAAKMVADGAIGEARHFEASYLQSWLRYETNTSSLRACTAADMLTATWHDVDVPAVESNYQRFIDAI